MQISPIYAGETAAIIGTGPSLTLDQVEQVSHLRRFGCNNAIEFNLDVHLACNWQWWDYNYDRVKDDPSIKWTPRLQSANKYPGVNYIEERWEDGLSTDPSYICAHHGSGPMILNVALLYGIQKFILIGWDMRFPGKKNDREYAEKRHYFGDGEYPLPLRHWPKTGPNGELAGLIREMETINPDDYGIDIVNCSPGSAMTCFRMAELADEV